ncbi:hypothetical protein Tco_0036458, partial [Tanacetum coccineum]
ITPFAKIIVLDSFAGDLENLLDAEEGDDEEEGNYESNHENLVGVKGLKVRRLPSQAQAEVENEDEAAEAAELCRMLMDCKYSIFLGFLFGNISKRIDVLSKN